MSEYTKGPWIWNGGYLISYIPDKFSAGGYQDFEIIADDGSAHGEYDVVLNPDSANARLIASAPDLLALALQYRDDLRHPPTADSITRRLAAIDAVLAKVTGDA